MEEHILFEKFKPMIHKKAYIYTKKYGINIEDVMLEGYLIFTKTLRKFNPELSSFSTYLYNNLQELENFCKSEKRFSVSCITNSNCYDPENGEMPELWFSNNKEFIQTVEMLESTKELDSKALEMLKYLVSRKWENLKCKVSRKPSLSLMMRYFRPRGWRKIEVSRSWKSLYFWWQKNYNLF